jgi:Uma2 family endonuclease
MHETSTYATCSHTFEAPPGRHGSRCWVENSDFEPDALLRLGPPLPGDATGVSDPLVLVEVLSPDSGTRDRATKRRAYFKLLSVQHYLIVWPDEQRIVRHSRLPNDQVATQIFVSGEKSPSIRRAPR